MRSLVLVVALLLLTGVEAWSQAPILVVRPGNPTELGVYDSSGNLQGGRDDSDGFIFPYQFLGDVLLTGDWDGDFYDEVVVVTGADGGAVVVHELLAPSSLIRDFTYILNVNSDLAFGSIGQVPLLADLDGDNTDEIVVATANVFADEATFEVYEVRNQGQILRLTRIRTVDSDEDFSFGFTDSIAAGDLDGDGRDEIVVARPSFPIRELASFDAYDLEGDRVGGAAGDLGVDFFMGLGEHLRVADVVGADGVDEVVIARRNVVPQFGSFDLYDADGDDVGGGAIDFGQIDSVEVGDVDGDRRAEIVIGKPAFIVGVQITPAQFDFYGSNGNLEGSSGSSSDFTFEGGWEFRVGSVPFSPLQTEQQDSDGDGLLDAWETTGLSIGGRVLNLAAMGADPDHKDLFLEIDWLPNNAPGQRVIQRLKQAFAFAPIDAGGVPNPDGQPGINLWVDTGNLVSGVEDSALTPNSCTDGIDNGGDGLTDSQEPSCQGAEGNFLSGTCFDGIDNGGDGLADGVDGDCRLVEGVGPGAPDAPNTCVDGVDNDGDGWVDEVDPDCQGVEDGVGPTGCTDGIDNDLDGLADAADPDCRVGDSFPAFTGGNQLPPSALAGLNETFYDLKANRDAAEDGGAPGSCSDGVDNGGGDENGDGVADVDLADPDCGNFDWPLRRFAFHYMIAAAPIRGTTSGGNLQATFNDTTQSWVEDEWAGATLFVAAAGFPGQLQIRNVTSNSATQLVLPRPSEDRSGDNSTCGDGLDNDGDGRVDAADVDCAVPAAGSNYVMSVSGGFAELGGNDSLVFNDDAGTFLHEVGHNLGLHHGGDEPDNCKPNYVSVMNYDHQFGIPQVGGGFVLDFSPPRFDGGRGTAPLPLLRENDLDENVALDPTDPANRIIFTDANGIKDDDHPVDGDFDRDGAFDGFDWDASGLYDGLGLQVDLDIPGTNGIPAGCANNLGLGNHDGHDDWSNLFLNFRLGGDLVDGAVNPIDVPSPTVGDMLELQRELHSSDLALEIEASPEIVEVGEDLTWTHRARNLGPSSVSAVSLSASLGGAASLSSSSSGCAVSSPGELDCSLGELAAREATTAELVVGTGAVCIDGVPQTISSAGTVGFAPVYGAFDLDPSNDRAELSVVPVDTTAPSITAPADVVAECTSPQGTPVDLGMPLVSDICDDSPTVTDDAPALFPPGPTTVQWRAEDAVGNIGGPASQTVTIVDTTDPVISCNAPAAIVPRDAPIAFTATATDICDGTLIPRITEFECFAVLGGGVRVDKGESCIVRFEGDTLIIEDSGGVGNHVAWEAVVSDAAGNETVQSCEVAVVRPGTL